MDKSSEISFKIDSELKSKANSILASIGLNSSDAVTMFYRQIVLNRGLPFEVKIPNEETIEAMQELNYPISRKTLKSSSKY